MVTIPDINNEDDFFYWLRTNLNASYPLNRITKDFHSDPGLQAGMAVSLGPNQKVIPANDDLDKFLGVIESRQLDTWRVVLSGNCVVPGITWQTEEVYYVDTNSFLTTTVTSKRVGIGIGNDNILVLSSSSSGGGSGTVTSVAATAGTGISITGSPITTSGTLNITNTAPDQTVVLTDGTGISVTGTYPNFTITNTQSPGSGTVTNIATTAPITGGPITTTGTIGITQASTSVDGYLSSVDWNIFNSKEPALGFTPENVANKSTTTTLGTSNTLYPTQNAVKVYVDNSMGDTDFILMASLRSFYQY